MEESPSDITLPPEIWHRIMFFLSPMDFYNAKSVCSEWSAYVFSDFPWTSYMNYYFGNWYQNSPILSDPKLDSMAKFWQVSRLHHNWTKGEQKTTILIGFQTPLRHMKLVGKHLAYSVGSGLAIWDLSTSRCHYTSNDTQYMHYYLPTFDIWDKYAIFPSMTDHSLLSIVDFSTKEKIQSIPTHQAVSVVRHAPQSNLVASGGRKISIWDTQNPSTPLLTFQEQHRGVVNCMELEVNTITACHKGKKVRMWDLRSGERIHTLSGHQNLIHCIGVNSEFIVSGSKDSTIKIWDRRKPTIPFTLLAHSGPVKALAVDEWKVASGGKDKVVCIWDIRSHERIGKITEMDSVNAVAFDESKLYVGSTLLWQHDFSSQKRTKPFDCVVN